MSKQHQQQSGPARAGGGPHPGATGAADGATSGLMAAVVQSRYGEPEDVVRPARVARPVLRDTDVLVRVAAAGVDRGVWHLVAGRPQLVRLAVGLRRPRQPIPGMDVAGRVEAVGPAVTRFRVGDDVFGAGHGTYATYTRASEKSLALRPASLTAVQAAAVPVSASTALQAVRDRARVRAGDRVLVLGASGGVGSFAVQIAKAYGAEVTGVCTTTKVDLVRGLGADHVVDHTAQDALGEAGAFDVILDIGGTPTVRRLRRALTPRGRLVIIGGESGGPLLGGIDRQMRAAALSPFVGQSMGTFVSSINVTDLEELARMADAGRLTAAVDRTFALDEVPAAIRYLQDGHVRGKVVITL